MQKLDKQKIEIQIVSSFWDYSRSGLCLYEDQPCWFEEVKEGLGFGDNEDHDDPHFNWRRSRVEVYALTKIDLDAFVNRSKKFAKEIGQATWFCRGGHRILDDKEAKALADSFIVDEKVIEATKDKKLDLSCCIGYYYMGAPKNTFDILFEDLGTTKSDTYKPPTEASIKRFNELKPMLEMFEGNEKFYYTVEANYTGGIEIEYEFNHGFDGSLDIHIDSEGQAQFTRYEYTQEYNIWRADPEREKKPEPKMLQFTEGKL